MPQTRPSSRRSTSNGNTSGNSYTRRARRSWMWDRFSVNGLIRCFHCPALLTKEEFHVDRWPLCGHDGGRYVRGNIVASCMKCNSGRCGKTCLRKRKRTKKEMPHGNDLPQVPVQVQP